MSQDIMKEVMFLIHSFVLGVVITFVYDGFLILRRLIKHTMLLVSLEDMLFWLACAISVFYMLYEENNGILRWFAVAGAALGMITYKKTLSAPVIMTVTAIIQFIFGFLAKLINFMLKPLHVLMRKTGSGFGILKRKGCKFAKFLKKKLTQYGKVLKIILCKH